MKTNKHLAFIWRYYRERPKLILLLFVLTLLSSAVAVAFPYLTKVLLDTIQRLLESGAPADETRREMGRLVMLILAVGLGGFVANLFPGVRGSMNMVYEHLIRTRYFAETLSKDHKFFAAFRSGDLVTRLTEDLYDFPKLSWFLCSGIFRAVESISKLLFCLATMLFLNWKLTLVSLVPLPIMIAIFYVAQDRIYDTFRRNQEAISDINSQLEMSFSGVRIIKAYACERKYERFLADALGRRYGTEMAVIRLEAVLHLIYSSIDYVAQVAVIFAGGWMAVRGSLSVGDFYAFYVYLGMLVYPILDIPQLFVSGKRAFVNMDRLEEIKEFPAPAPRPDRVPAGPMASIEARALGFSYGDRGAAEGGEAEATLRDINFRVGAGERLAVIGPVGSGKSTLVKMLAGLLEPGSGELLLDGRKVGDIDPDSLAAAVGYVPQDPLLFSGTIRENIAFGSPGDGTWIGDMDFAEAIGLAQMSAEVRGFSEGPETLLGQRGVAVSGGQKQRLAIARALARKPRLLILDDITASLDATNEERLWTALGERFKDLATVVVSHRLSTLQYVDKVLFLEGGRMAGFGGHEELLRGNAAYRSFMEEHLVAAN